ncbi:MAG: 2-hydroxyacid dehydrogenase [Hyphomicrobiales bacterium]|nr:2-hydroxyacid dehydrogenase [Hyphomicrobiales bacterium]MDE2113355.1 2-hydroxyacid dehydrogenase [Hyphomicrobiales bacterium]
MPDFEILMPAPMMPMISEQLSARARLHKLWEADDKVAEMARLAPRIKALAVGGGHQPIDAGFLAQFPTLEIVASFGVGYDHVDVNAARQRGVIVTHTPNVLNEEVADTALGLLLATVRQLPQADRFLRSGAWPKGNFPLTATLRGRSLGIVGLGRIGKAIATRAEAFGLSVSYHGRNVQKDVPYSYYPTLLGLAKACDILLVITPGGAGTQQMINAQVLEALGPTGIFINVARGSVVDEPALIAALQKGTILSAGLDVFAHEPNVPQALIDMPHVVLLPHVGSATHHTRDAMAQLVIDNLLAWQKGQPPLTPVPETPFPLL